MKFSSEKKLMSDDAHWFNVSISSIFLKYGYNISLHLIKVIADGARNVTAANDETDPVTVHLSQLVQWVNPSFKRDFNYWYCMIAVVL